MACRTRSGDNFAGSSSCTAFKLLHVLANDGFACPTSKRSRFMKFVAGVAVDVEARGAGDEEKRLLFVHLDVVCSCSLRHWRQTCTETVRIAGPADMSWRVQSFRRCVSSVCHGTEDRSRVMRREKDLSATELVLYRKTLYPGSL
jgi:hypothetical protein